MANKQFPVTSSSQMSKIFLYSLVVNSFVLILGNTLFPSSIVLGNASLSSSWALFISMSFLSLVNMLFVPVFEYLQDQKQKELTSKDWMTGYLVLNFSALWVISRFAEQFGLGFSAWWVILLLSLVLDFVQGMAMMLVYGKK